MEEDIFIYQAAVTHLEHRKTGHGIGKGNTIKFDVTFATIGKMAVNISKIRKDPNYRSPCTAVKHSR